MNYCNRQCKDSCYTIDIGDIDNLLYGIDKQICKTGESNLNSLQWGYGCTDFGTISELTLYQKTLTRQKERLARNGQPCLCSDELQYIVEKVKDLVPKAFCGECTTSLNTDDSNLDSWVKSNPNCCSYEQWNTYSKKVCDGLDFKLITEKQRCDITYELETNIIPCNLLIAAESFREACEFKYKVNRTKEECKLDYKLLLEKEPKCDLEYKTYLELIDCGMTYDIIKEVYCNDLKLKVDLSKEEGCRIELQTKLNSYCFKDLAVDVNLLKKNNLKPTINVKKFLTDYKK